MNLLSCIFIVLTCSVFAQSKDTSFVIKTPSSIIQLHSDYIVEAGSIQPTWVNFSIQLRIQTDIIDEALNKGIQSDAVILELIYNEECELKGYNMIKKSSVEAYNNWIPVYFDELKGAFNSSKLHNFLRFFKDSPCGLGELELPIQIQ